MFSVEAILIFPPSLSFEEALSVELAKFKLPLVEFNSILPAISPEASIIEFSLMLIFVADKLIRPPASFPDAIISLLLDKFIVDACK